MKKIKIFLMGSAGKMGQEIKKLAAKDRNISFVEKIEKCDVVVEFTHAEGFSKNIQAAQKNKKAFVSGTTGLSLAQKKELQRAAQIIPVLWSPNMSMGVAAINKMLEVFSLLKDYDFYIEETHHVHKKDAPSGTALLIQENLEKKIRKKVKKVTSNREGDVFGEHRIRVIGPEETLLLEHHANNRTVFARGTLRCAKWIVGKKRGLYSLEDVNT